MRDPVQIHFDKVAPAYRAALEKYPWRWLRLRESKAVAELLTDVRGKTAIDIGCGTGAYTEQLVALGAREVTAVDACSRMLDELSTASVQKICAALPEVRIEKQFDVILAPGVLEFVPDSEAALRNLRRLAHEKTKLVVLIPVPTFFGRVYRRFHARHEIKASLFSRGSLERLARLTQWQVEDYTFCWPFSGVARLSPIVESKYT